MQEKPTLEPVIQAFEHWRTHRRSRSEGTPEHLKKQAVALLQTHRATEIAKALRISGTNLKNWRSPTSVPQPKRTDAFVELSAPQPQLFPSGTQPAVLRLSLRHPGGTEVTLQGNLNNDYVTALLKSIGFNGGVVS